MNKALGLTLVFVTSAAWLLCLGVARAQAPSVGNDQWERYRAPWPERVDYERDGGCPVQYPICDPNDICYYHSVCTPQYAWAIDLNNKTDETQGPNSDCDDSLGADPFGPDPLRATRGGAFKFYPMNYGGYGSSYLGLVHYNGPGDLDSTWYVHVDYPNDAVYWDPQEQWYRSWDDLDVLAQGDFVARMGNKGTDDCHLHLYFADGDDRWYPSFNVWMSGVWPWTGYDLQQLSDDAWTGHASNNTGPGYGRPYYGSCPDPLWEPGRLCYDRGVENRPIIWSIRTLARNLAAYTVDVGSTRAAIQGPCGANRRWVKSCSFGYSGVGFTQSFVLSAYGLEIPLSITEGPDGNAYRVTKAMWKAYGMLCTGNNRVYELIGKPINEEYHIEGTDLDRQDFQYGHLRANRHYGQNVYVYVYDNSWDLICTLGGFYDWLDLENEPCYDVNGDAFVDITDVFLTVRHWRTREDDPSPNSYGFDYDDRYDVNRDGYVDITDVFIISKSQPNYCR